MASLTLTGGSGYFEWTISGLSNWFATNQYISAGITSKSFSGGTTSISGIVDVVYATDDGTEFEVSNIVRYQKGTFTFYGFAQGSDGTYWPTGSDTVTIKSNRPDKFSWTNEKVSGREFNLTATEWNNLTYRINEVRAYKGLPDYSFTVAYTGDEFTADIYNEAREAIQDVPGYGTYIPEAFSGDTITASYMEAVVNELNAIP